MDFDRYRTSYGEEVGRSIAFSGRDLEHFTRMKARLLLDLVRRHLGDPVSLTALDVGCGIGLTDRFLAGEFERLEGVDIAPGVVEVAAMQNPAVRYRCCDGTRLPFAEGAFDVSFAICVLHHVPPGLWSTSSRGCGTSRARAGSLSSSSTIPGIPLLDGRYARAPLTRGLFCSQSGQSRISCGGVGCASPNRDISFSLPLAASGRRPPSGICAECRSGPSATWLSSAAHCLTASQHSVRPALR